MGNTGENSSIDGFEQTLKSIEKHLKQALSFIPFEQEGLTSEAEYHQERINEDLKAQLETLRDQISDWQRLVKQLQESGHELDLVVTREQRQKFDSLNTLLNKAEQGARRVRSFSFDQLGIAYEEALKKTIGSEINELKLPAELADEFERRRAYNKVAKGVFGGCGAISAVAGLSTTGGAALGEAVISSLAATAGIFAIAAIVLTAGIIYKRNRSINNSMDRFIMDKVSKRAQPPEDNGLDSSLAATAARQGTPSTSPKPEQTQRAKRDPGAERTKRSLAGTSDGNSSDNNGDDPSESPGNRMGGPGSG